MMNNREDKNDSGEKVKKLPTLFTKKKTLILVLSIIALSIISLIYHFILKKEKSTLEIGGSEYYCDCDPNNIELVCGDDFITYENECVADCYGVKVLYKEKCKVYKSEDPILEGCPECKVDCSSEGGIMYIDDTGCPTCRCFYDE